jgi:Domain of unknown function (DUF5655)
MAAQPNALAHADPLALALYRELLVSVQSFGPFQEEVKKSSIHLVRSSAFAGVHFRKHALALTITAAAPIDSPRVLKTEQVSTNRWHLDTKLTIDGDIDHELLTWLRTAYDLCA